MARGKEALEGPGPGGGHQCGGPNVGSARRGTPANTCPCPPWVGRGLPGTAARDAGLGVILDRSFQKSHSRAGAGVHRLSQLGREGQPVTAAPRRPRDLTAAAKSVPGCAGRGANTIAGAWGCAPWPQSTHVLHRPQGLSLCPVCRDEVGQVLSQWAPAAEGERVLGRPGSGERTGRCAPLREGRTGARHQLALGGGAARQPGAGLDPPVTRVNSENPAGGSGRQGQAGGQLCRAGAGGAQGSSRLLKQ